MMTRAKKQLQQEQTPTPSNLSTPLSNEEETALAHIIRNIVKEELQVHKVVYQEIVSSNFKVTNERLEKLSEEVSEIKKTKQRQLKKTLKHYKKSLNEIEKDLLDPEDITNKLIELEDRLRRNNPRIDGIVETNHDSWEICKENNKREIKNSEKY